MCVKLKSEIEFKGNDFNAGKCSSTGTSSSFNNETNELD